MIRKDSIRGKLLFEKEKGEKGFDFLKKSAFRIILDK